MSEATRKHKNVINIRDATVMSGEKGTRFGYTSREVGMDTGSVDLGCAWYEQAPGRTAFPKHFHCGNEEAIYVLEGRGEVAIGDDLVQVEPGDFISFPAGPEHAHRITNTGTEPLRYLCFSTMRPLDVVVYPDSKKVLAKAGPRGASYGDPPWIRSMHRQTESVDYYDGEDVD